MAERAVRTVKDMWKRETDKNAALMAYRSSPLESGYSPAQLLYGRQIRTRVYDSGRMVDLEEFRRRDLEVKGRQTKSTDKRRRAKVMEELRVGDRVWVKESKDAKGHEGIVIRKASEPQAYWVEVNGRFLRRTRVHLRKLEREDLQEGLNEREEVSWEPERMEY